jgi:nicotinamidase-related amidase
VDASVGDAPRTERSVARGLLIIDIQRDYFPGGGFPLVEPEAAAENARDVLASFRRQSLPVVHMQHVWDADDATFMRPGTEGIEIHPLVAPEGGEPVLRKTAPNSFLDTGLEDELRGRDVDELVVVGMMTSTCVDSSVRAASELGFEVTLVHDACAAPDLEFGGVEVPGASVHAAFVAALDDEFATVVAAADLA